MSRLDKMCKDGVRPEWYESALRSGGLPAEADAANLAQPPGLALMLAWLASDVDLVPGQCCSVLLPPLHFAAAKTLLPGCINTALVDNTAQTLP